MNILRRKVRSAGLEYILVDRGPGTYQPYVVGTASELSLSHGEWFWGHYFTTLADAIVYFESQS
jgi:hypothetical protein